MEKFWRFCKHLFSHLRHPNIVILVVFFLSCMVVFSLERVLLWLTLQERFAEAETVNIIKAFFVGLRFDCVVAAMAIAPFALVLCFSPKILCDWRWFRWILSALLSLVFSALTIGSACDYFFVKEFDTRLNWQIFEYFHYDYVHAVIWEKYPVIPVFFGGFLLFLLFFLFMRTPALWRTTARLGPRIAIGLIVPVILFGAIRSSFGPKAINTGPAFFSNHFIVAELALNGLFTLREAAYDRYARDHEAGKQSFEDMSDEEALDKTRNLLETEQDTFLGNEKNPLLRVTDTGKPQKEYNVVLVVMESLSWHYIETLGGEPGLTPNLDRIAEHGILMDRCFAVGGRTTYGMSGAIAGFPDVSGQSVTTRGRSENNFLTLPGVLERRDYQTMFIYGGQAMYDHRQAFLGSNGISRLITDENFSHTTYETELGWCDGDLFREAHSRFSKVSEKDDPFFALLLTLSFHRPYKIPSGKVEPVKEGGEVKRQLTCVRYTDHAIGEFIETAKQSDYFENTVFVFTSDHTGGEEGHPVAVHNYRLPFIIYAPGIIGKGGQRVSRVCSLTDIPPTILSLLGGKFRHSFFGTNVLEATSKDPFAFLRHGSKGMAYINKDQSGVVIPFTSDSRFFSYKAPSNLNYLDSLTPEQEKTAAQYKRNAIAIHKSARYLFENGAYEAAPGEQGKVDAAHNEDSR